MRDGRLERIDTPPNLPDTDERPRLIPCARGRALRRFWADGARVLTPLRRAGERGSGEFVPVSWDSALDEVAERLQGTVSRWGGEAVLHACGAGSMGGRGLSGIDASRRFFQHLAPVTETAGSFSDHSVKVASQCMFGEVIAGSDRATLLDSRLIIPWGMNPAETVMGPNTPWFIARARDRGARVILIDPRYTDTGVLADRWIPIRPGTDVALVAALAYVMEQEGLVDRAFLERYTTGYAEYQAYILGQADCQPKTPAWAAPITGVDESTITSLAREVASTRPAAILPGWGPQRGLYGEQAARAFITLACITGNVGLRGGGEAGLGTRTGDLPIEGMPAGPYPAMRRVRKWTWAAEVSAPGYFPAIRLAYVVGTNLINRSPDTGTGARVFAGLDFSVVHELVLTPTARLADVVLPICTDLERSDLVTSWGHDSHLFDSRAAVAPAGDSRTDYWVFSRLAERLGFGSAYTQGRSEAEWLEALLAASDLGDRAVWEAGVLRADPAPRVALAEFRADPAAHPLRTPSGRIEIASRQAQPHGLPDIPSFVPVVPEPAERDFPLQLITPHSKKRSHSCPHTVPWLQAIEPHAVWISAADARARGIAAGETVEVESAVGRIRLPANVTERIMPGVVCVYQGAWYRPAADGVDEGACANALAPARMSPSGGPTTHTAWVQVRKASP